MAHVVHPKLSGEDFEALAANHGWSFEVELIDGEAVVIPPDGPGAASVGLELAVALRRWQEQRERPGLMLPSVFVKLDEHSRLGPDLAWWAEAWDAPLPTGQMTVTPDWVAEVLSPSTRANDLGPKRDAYLAAGVRELWLVDPVVQVVTIVDADGAERDSGPRCESGAIPGFAVDTASLFPF